MAPVSANSSIMQHIKRQIDDVICSPEDKRVYRGLELTNDLKILLISDPKTDKSAASLDVNTGHLNDPDELPGLAHFCEHMLFLGTEKYPIENEYQKFLTTHGGNSNAYTGADQTNYHFDVSPEFLEGAIDRFAQFFISPLFTESGTEREVLAVDSEYKIYLRDDMWRLEQLKGTLSKSTHPFRKFNVGSRKTLFDDPKLKNLDPRNELLKFYERFYSSNLMNLTVLGKESLDELTQMVAPIFAQIPNRNLKRPDWPEHPYGPEQLGYRVNVVPIKDLRSLNVYFPIPDLNLYYKTSPGHYVGHLIGHEGKGSLLSKLKNLGWVNSLNAGPSTMARGFGFFTIDFNLSEDGLNHVDDIIELFFQYISLLKQDGPQEWVYREVEKINKMHFRFQDKHDPIHDVVQVSSNLHIYPINEVLYGPYVMGDYKPELINSLINDLNVENFCYLVISNQFSGKTSKIEEWFGTEYSIEKSDPILRDKCLSCLVDPDLKLPETNEFIPTTFDLYDLDPSKKGAHPEMFHCDEMVRAWFKQDDEYLLPKCFLLFHFRSPVSYESPLNNALSSLYVELLHDSLTEYAYNAELAGLNYHFGNGRYGFTLNISGYNEKQKILLENLIENFVTFVPKEKRFQILKERFVRELRNFEKEQPNYHSYYYANLILTEKIWTNDEILKEAENLTIDQLKAFIPKYFGALHLEAYIHGNSDKNDASHVINTVQDTLHRFIKYKPLYNSQIEKDRAVKLDDGKAYVFRAENKTHPNSAIDLILQTGVENPRLNMLNELLNQILSESFFDQLRTKEQLGYSTSSSVRRENGAQSLVFAVQGEKSPDFVETRIEAFLADLEKSLIEMPDKEFEDHKKSLAALRLEKPKNLYEMASKYWSEIYEGLYHFNRDKEEVEVLKTLTKKDVLDFYMEFVSSKAKNRKKLSVYVYSTKTKDEKLTEIDKNVIKIEDIVEFKKYQPLYQLPKPYKNVPPAGLNELKSKI